MGPIPKYGIMALLFSILVAFTINPWVSYLVALDVHEGDHHEKKASKWDIRIFYNRLMLKIISPNKQAKKWRKIIKWMFW